ncbi:MAG: hypothetical protein KTR31_33350 [Myxococcales bacterium]|nr:hypothetical protein [Myxococcales bacterium]
MTLSLMSWIALDALAHRPQAVEERLVIELPKISHVIGGEFVTGDEVFTVVLEYDTPFAMPMEMQVPRLRALENHRPVFAIVGPGLPEPTPELLDWLPAEVPEGMGVWVQRNDEPEREVYFEQVMRRTMWTTGSLAVHFPSAGTYEVWIWSPDFSVGEFWYGFGVEEDFSGGAWGGVFDDWGLFGW